VSGPGWIAPSGFRPQAGSYRQAGSAPHRQGQQPFKVNRLLLTAPVSPVLRQGVASVLAAARPVTAPARTVCARNDYDFFPHSARPHSWQ
jgi:hypothetical protein